MFTTLSSRKFDSLTTTALWRPSAGSKRLRRYGWRRAAAEAAVLGTILILAFGTGAEVRTAWLQSELLSSFAGQLDFALESGPSPSIRFPSAGPYDRRLGYVELPAFAERLSGRGYAIEQQARISERHREIIDLGAFPIFREKTRAGLTILDQHGAAIYKARFPERIYPSFETIPPLVADTLLFIENRELLDPGAARRNPAIEWDRLAAVLLRALLQAAEPSAKSPGGSTLATQIEKFRHSLYGRTDDVVEKLRQISSASLRAYLDGPDTTNVRRQILVDYLNSTPLSARPGFGEVSGLGDGLYTWFGTELELANRLLREDDPSAEGQLQRARLYKEALSLLLAQRRPSYYLLTGRSELNALTNSYLRLLRAGGVIDPRFAQFALDQALEFQAEAPTPADVPFVDLKAANAIRTELLDLLGVPGLYQLDRLDLGVQASLDLPTQERVTEFLRRLDDPASAKELGLYGDHLLASGTSGGKLIVSLTLYERGDRVNRVRLQADNLDQPFDINQGAKLDLGSTAKLRTLINYLEIIAALHDKFADLPASELQVIAAKAQDPLTGWVADDLASRADKSLPTLLSGAMARRYSASPWERFFTGGGLHQFANFDADDNDRILSVAEAFRNSVNLVFIRLIRDIVKYYLAQGTPEYELLNDVDNPLRRQYLERFADREGQTFLNQFYDEFAGLSADGALAKLAQQARPRADRLAVIFRSVRSRADRGAFARFLRTRMPDRTLSDREIDRLYASYRPGQFSLNERGYLASLHPLKLWLVAYLQEHPNPERAEMLAASAEARQESYSWLFKAGRKPGQDERIRILLEEEAFEKIWRDWRRLGYPFDRLVPSDATAIGSSADRPEALAELIGIILNDGIWQPTVRVERLHFATNTPYETVLGLRPEAPKPLLAPEIAAEIRKALVDVVENGTARRLNKAYVSATGTPMLIGAKTGTGDNRRKTFARDGRLINSEVISRTATVVFFIGDAFFGNLTVYVPGHDAADFSFTSSLPAQLLKRIAPALQPLVDRSGLRPNIQSLQPTVAPKLRGTVDRRGRNAWPIHPKGAQRRRRLSRNILAR